MKPPPVLELTRRDPALVLVVHGDEALRTLQVESLLFFTNYRVVEACDGRDAIDKIRRHRPRVVVVDVGTRGRSADGWTVVAALRSDPSTCHAGVIAISSEADLEADTGRAAAERIDALVVEPIRPAELAAQVQRLCGRASSPSVPRVCLGDGPAHALGARSITQGR